MRGITSKQACRLTDIETDFNVIYHSNFVYGKSLVKLWYPKQVQLKQKFKQRYA